MNELVPAKQTLVLEDHRDFDGDKVRYAREVILWGRKSDRLLNAARWTGEKIARPKQKCRSE